MVRCFEALPIITDSSGSRAASPTPGSARPGCPDPSALRASFPSSQGWPVCTDAWWSGSRVRAIRRFPRFIPPTAADASLLCDGSCGGRFGDHANSAFLASPLSPPVRAVAQRWSAHLMPEKRNYVQCNAPAYRKSQASMRSAGLRCTTTSHNWDLCITTQTRRTPNPYKTHRKVGKLTFDFVGSGRPLPVPKTCKQSAKWDASFLGCPAPGQRKQAFARQHGTRIAGQFPSFIEVRIGERHPDALTTLLRGHVKSFGVFSSEAPARTSKIIGLHERTISPPV